MDIDEKIREAQLDLAIELRRLRAERHVWRDYRGLVHIIRPVVDVDNRGGPYVAHWVYLCGDKTLSRGLTVREPDAVPTCLLCIGDRS